MSKLILDEVLDVRGERRAAACHALKCVAAFALCGFFFGGGCMAGALSIGVIRPRAPVAICDPSMALVKSQIPAVTGPQGTVDGVVGRIASRINLAIYTDRQPSCRERL